MSHIRVTALAIALTSVAMLTAPSSGSAQSATSDARSAPATKPTPSKKGYVLANGVNYYYEIHGRGEPLLLLHGGLGSIDMFTPLLPTLAKDRQIIGVDLHGHGRTALGERPISLIDIGDDLAIVLERLGYQRVDVMGYSFGGGAGLQLAIQHPSLVRRLVVASAPYARDGFHPEMLPQQAAVGAAMAEQMKQTPMYISYAAVAPKPQDFPRLLDRMGELMRQPYDWAEDVKKLQMPVMLIYGDADMIRPDHIVRFYQLLGGGLRDAGWMREHMSKNRLAILPDLTHYEVFMSPLLATTALPFLNGQSNAPSWGGQVKQKN
jgi:pimeloyl-ACP methyl ester carboxylesterase